MKTSNNKLDIQFLPLIVEVDVLGSEEKTNDKGDKYIAVTVKGKSPSATEMAFVDSTCELKSDKMIQAGKRKLKIKVVPYTNGNRATYSLRIVGVQE